MFLHRPCRLEETRTKDDARYSSLGRKKKNDLPRRVHAYDRTCKQIDHKARAGIYEKALLHYTVGMVKDKSRNLAGLSGLECGLGRIRTMEGTPVSSMASFSTDGKNSYFYTVLSGSALCATTWREMPDNTEITGAFTAKAGEAVLYLPGEPRLVKVSDDGEVSVFVLEN